VRVLIAHNFYQQPGGEDQVFRAERDLLREFGHEVSTFEVHNDDVPGMGRLALVAATVWNRPLHARLREAVRAFRPDVVHFHNTFPLLSPAAYYAAKAEGAAVVQTLHNFRLLCPGALLSRGGLPCESCVGRTFAWPGVARGCYRGSRAATGVTAAAVGLHRLAGTWAKAVDAYIALTPFAREKFLAGGLPAERIVVKPNFVHPDPGSRGGAGGYVAFVGRLSEEKGIDTLLQAWVAQGASAVPLKIVGDGPLADAVSAAAATTGRIQWLGRRSADEVAGIMGGAAAVVFPSKCYETFGRVAIEAFAVGTPVVASAHGAMADVVGSDNRLGRLFRPGDGTDLAAQLRALLADGSLPQVRRTCRAEFEAKYTGPQNYHLLLAVYRRAMATARGMAAEHAPALPPDASVAAAGGATS